jgi:chemotaxis protein CheY-P-specific phosphatase CheC/CheY-like chemotaxis protein
MDRFPKLEKMLLAALNQAALDGGMLLGQDLTVKESEFSTCKKEDFVKKLEDASFIIGVKSQEDYEGKFYLIVTLRDAIVLGSLLLGVPPARASEKMKLAILETDDVDAFNEFTNQVIGSFNSVFKPTLPKKVHLKLLESNKFIPGSDGVNADEPIPDGEYFLFRAEFGIPQQELDRIDILIPATLASFYDLQENTGSTTCAAEEGAADDAAETPEGAAEERSVLILEENSMDLQFFQETLSATEIKTMSAPLDADLTGFFSTGQVKAVLLGAVDVDDRELSICIKIKSISPHRAVPIIMCAPEWTRVGVLKALKYGASDIIVKPCTQDELKGKLAKYLNAA